MAAAFPTIGIADAIAITGDMDQGNAARKFGSAA
jgi:hypothetical protein